MYKFVCDPEALFQMALAENHRNALKAEAASVLKGSSATTTAEPDEPSSRRHRYSDMLNQVYTSHLSAQLQQQPPPPPPPSGQECGFTSLDTKDDPAAGEEDKAGTEDGSSATATAFHAYSHHQQQSQQHQHSGEYGNGGGGYGAEYAMEQRSYMAAAAGETQTDVFLI